MRHYSQTLVGLTTFLFMLLCAQTYAQRHVIDLKNWQFSRDKVNWQDVTVPHDWAISGPFDKKWDLQTVRIEQNGEKVATEKSGRSGSLPWIGKGYYKCIVNSANANYELRTMHYELNFDERQESRLLGIRL